MLEQIGGAGSGPSSTQASHHIGPAAFPARLSIPFGGKSLASGEMFRIHAIGIGWACRSARMLDPEGLVVVLRIVLLSLVGRFATEAIVYISRGVGRRAQASSPTSSTNHRPHLTGSSRGEEPLVRIPPSLVEFNPRFTAPVGGRYTGIASRLVGRNQTLDLIAEADHT
jgi:hypothetical protein